MIGLKINNPQHLDLRPFCQYLIPIIRAHANDYSKINSKLEELWNDYLKEIFIEVSDTPTLKKIIRIYFDNLVINRNPEDLSYTITGNSNIKYPASPIKIDTLVELITRGNLDVNGYSIFDDVYEDIKIRVPTLYNIWKGL